MGREGLSRLQKRGLGVFVVKTPQALGARAGSRGEVGGADGPRAEASAGVSTCLHPRTLCRLSRGAWHLDAANWPRGSLVLLWYCGSSAWQSHRYSLLRETR